jgi:hypothetical protein
MTWRKVHQMTTSNPAARMTAGPPAATALSALTAPARRHTPASPLFELPVWDGLPARLSLVRPGQGPVRIDGAWWPRTRDAAKELPPLLAALGGRWGRITRITLDGTGWLEGPSAMVIGGHTLRINRSYARGHQDAVCLLCPGVGRCDLVVVPPETGPVPARRMLAAAVVRM